MRSWESKEDQIKRLKAYNRFLKGKGLPEVDTKLFLNDSVKAPYKPSRSEKHYRKEKQPKTGEVIQNSYGDESIGSTNRQSNHEFYDRIPRVKGNKETRKYQKIGGKATPLSAVKSGKTKNKAGKGVFNNISKLQHEVNMTQKRIPNSVRKIDEINSATFLNNDIMGEPRSRIVKAFSAAHKRQQEANKKKAMKKFKNPYSRTKEVGHNLRRGQADGDKGRKIAHNKNKK